MARVVLQKLSKMFRGKEGEEFLAVKNVDLAVEDKEFLVLVGPSGCGKSTTLRLIAGLEEPSQGTVMIDGRVMNAVSPKDRDIAMVFQNHALYPHLTSYDNMKLGLKLRKIPNPEIERRVREAAEILGIDSCLDRLPAALSGGERQRVAVGRALVLQPKVFLFDEPLSNLDAPMRAQMRREISILHRRLGVTMIYVTHDQLEAMTMGNRIAVMREGVIQQVSAPMSIYRRPVNRFVAGFIGSPAMNFIRGRLIHAGATACFHEEGGGAGAPSGGIVARVEDAQAASMVSHVTDSVVCGLRPEDVIAEKGSSSDGDAHRRTAMVEFVEPLGAETYLHLATSAHLLVARAVADSAINVGQRVQVRFNMSKACFFDPVTGEAILSESICEHQER